MDENTAMNLTWKESEIIGMKTDLDSKNAQIEKLEEHLKYKSAKIDELRESLRQIREQRVMYKAEIDSLKASRELTIKQTDADRAGYEYEMQYLKGQVDAFKFCVKEGQA